jgi:hypothetical protein
MVSEFLPPVPYLSGFSSPSDRSDPATCRENTKYEMSGRFVPLFGLPRPATERPHRWSDGLGPNLRQTIQSPTPTFSHKRYTRIRNSEVSFPLHSEMILNLAVSSNPGSSSFSPIRNSYSLIPYRSATLPNSPCTKQIRSCRERRVLLNRSKKSDTMREKRTLPPSPYSAYILGNNT